MFPLEPQEQFTVVRQLADHTDSNTYYVRATVRDAKTDALLDRFALGDKGDRRYSTTWQVVSDPSGLGRYISVLTEVFTDVDYTIKADTYGDEMETYKVQVSSKNLGGFGGVSIDYRLIKKMIDKALDEKIKEPTPIQLPKMRFKEVIQAVKDVQEAVQGIELPDFPTIPPVDFSLVVSEIKALQNVILKAVAAIPGRDKNDIAPLADALAKLDIASLNSVVRQTVEDFTEIMNQIKEFSDGTPEMQTKMKELTDDFKDIMYNMTVAGYNAKATLPKKEEPKGPDRKAIVSAKLLNLRR